MQQVLFLVGISGCGKTTFADDFLRRNSNWVRLSRDRFRKALIETSMRDYFNGDPDYRNHIEALIDQLRADSIRELAKKGYNLLFDDTNTRYSYIETALLALPDDRDYIIDFKVFDVSVKDAVRRDAGREMSVGEAVIERQHTQLVTMLKEYDLKKTYRQAGALSTPVAIERDRTKIKAIIVDIDGTVATMNGRGPFDWDLVHTDTPREDVLAVLRGISQSRVPGMGIIFVSGREESCRELTELWIAEHFKGGYLTLFMRPTGDNRPDEIVKREIYQQHIEPNYYVVGVIDDRPRVLRIWRSLGLTTFDVGHGIEF